MASILLDSKLHPPPGRSGLVVRSRLLQHLEEGLQRKLTLLSAPAGFGKTTLLVDWVSYISSRAHVTWYSIDEADNDPERFYEYLLAALQSIYPDLGKNSPTSPDFTRLRFEPLLTSVLNELTNLPTPLVLILDDYHLIEEQIIHQAIDFLLDHQPAHFHLVLATRADPPLHLSRLRGRNQVNEVRLTDLRFTTEEAAAFISQAMGLSLSPDQIASLTSRTEGWIAGLQLAALSLRGHEDQGRFIQSFAGSTHFILDYLTDEVFKLQPAYIQDFLLQTAILNRMSGPLCDAVCQIAPGGSQKILDNLEHTNLFILPLDDRQEWYRYHQLFADLLRQRLGQDRPNMMPTLYQRAGEWCEQNGLRYDAVEYAFSSGDFERAAHLIQGISQALLMHGRSATLLRWLERLPPPYLDGRPTLVADYAWALLFCSRPIDAIQDCLNRLDAQSPGLPIVAESGPIAIRTLPLRAMLALYRGQIDQALELALQSLNHLDAGEVYLRGVAGLVHAISLSAGYDLEQYFPAIQQAAAAGEKSGNLLVTVLALVSLAENERKLGRLHQSHAHLEQAIQLGVDAQGHKLPITGRALIGLGDLVREWNDLEQARQLIQEGIALLEQAELVGAFHGYMILARIEQSNGDIAASRKAIQQAIHSALAFDLTDLDDQTVAMLDARLSILQGDLDVAVRWVESRHLMTEKGPSLEAPDLDPYLARFRKYELVVLARLLLALAQPEQALTLLQFLFGEFERVDRPAMRIEICLLQAQAFHALGEQARALNSLEQALVLAEPEGYIRTFLDDGDKVIFLLDQAAARPAPGQLASIIAYIHRLLAAAGATATPPPPPAPETILIEPLSAREREVLRMLAGSLSAAEIASELVVSPSTIHSHIKSIYTKLEVHSRYQAIAKAKSLKLI